MAQSKRTPDARRTIEAHGSDLEMLKRRVRDARDVGEEILYFSHFGVLSATVSPYAWPSIAGKVVEAKVAFVTAGTTTCTIRIKKNGVVAQTWNFGAGSAGLTFQPMFTVRADVDTLQLDVSDAGEGWEDCTVRLLIVGHRDY